DLDHISPEPGQHLGAGRSCLVVREIDDANAFESLAHAACPLRFGWRDALSCRARFSLSAPRGRRGSGGGGGFQSVCRDPPHPPIASATGPSLSPRKRAERGKKPTTR